MNPEFEKSNAIASSIWRLFAESFEGAEITARKNISINWADKPFSFYNSIFLTGSINEVAVLKETVDEAITVASRKSFPGLLSVCRDLLSESVQAQVDSVFAERGYSTVMPVTGMVAESCPRASPGPASLRIERADDRGVAVTDLNCLVYGLPLESGRASLLKIPLWQSAFPYVGYEGDRPVTTATTIVHDDVLYLALVATAPDARGKGYAEAVIRHSLQKAHESTGLNRTVLHATQAGFPLYKRMGYQTVANFSWYMPDHQ
ncbi:GNAT family N-acetyltransferase [Granulicella sp. S190]|uniref:GNAT family N-acetyltransferase n=1 Tax=Granulicella sp. S190 TaxID=1747226 RepID=UPI00131D41AC|nr:GNAT family N-acetyltransferase [Granulicella sp. S190]